MELMALRDKAESHTHKIRGMEDKFKALCEELNSARVRVSELTSENAALETAKNDLTGRIEELIAQKATGDSISAELVQEKQSPDTEKGTKKESAFSTYCLSCFLCCLETELKAQAESHTQKICEMEDKLTALRGELDAAQARISKLISENSAMEAAKCDLETKFEELLAKKEVFESAKFEEEKMRSHQKGFSLTD